MSPRTSPDRLWLVFPRAHSMRRPDQRLEPEPQEPTQALPPAARSVARPPAALRYPACLAEDVSSRWIPPAPYLPKQAHPTAILATSTMEHAPLRPPARRARAASNAPVEPPLPGTRCKPRDATETRRGPQRQATALRRRPATRDRRTMALQQPRSKLARGVLEDRR